MDCKPYFHWNDSDASKNLVLLGYLIGIEQNSIPIFSKLEVIKN